MPLDYTHLKVDQTVIHYGDTFILVSNINIPESYFLQLENVLDRTVDFINLDYLADRQTIQYQVCATYDLRNSITQEIRHWSGSFNPKGNRHNILCDFQHFDPGTFRHQIQRACSPDNIYNRLRFFHVQTAWVFDKITSVIICLQGSIGVNHPTIERRGLLDVRNARRHNRIHLTFYLA